MPRKSPQRHAQKQKPTVGLVTEVGCLRFDLSFHYCAISPHNGALLQQQQMQAPILILWLTGYLYHTATGVKVNSRRPLTIPIGTALYCSITRAERRAARADRITV